MLEKSSQFLSSENSTEMKNRDVALSIVGAEKYAEKTFNPGQTGGHLIFVLNGRGYVSDGGNLCPLWLAILKSL